MFLVLFFTAVPALAAPGDQPAPAGFRVINSAPGVVMFQKDYANGSPDYVQVIDLDLGAQVHVLHGGIAVTGQGAGVYGGDNPRFGRQSIRKFWNELAGISGAAFCVTNGQFFRMADSPTPLPFPLKKGGQILSDGYGIKEFPGQKLMLEIWSDQLDVRELTEDALYSSSAPDIVAGLTEDAEKASKKAVGRTFVGILDRDDDGRFETLLILNTRVARPPDAADVLRSFGAQKVMMLDGGGSTQLVCNDGVYINTDRLIPQALGTTAANLAPLAASLIQPGNIDILSIDEPATVSLHLRNRGAETWQPSDTQFIIESEDGSRTEIGLSAAIVSGEHVELTYLISPVTSAGLHQAKVALVSKGAIFPVEAGSFVWILIPSELQPEVEDLRQRFLDWQDLSVDDQASQVQAWLADHQRKTTGGTGGVNIVAADSSPINPVERSPIETTKNLSLSNTRPKVDINNAIWIPCVVIPLVALFLGVIRRTQQPDFD